MDTRRALEIVACRHFCVFMTFGAEVLDHLCEGVVGRAEQLVDELGLVGIAVADEVQTVLGLQPVRHQVDLR